MDENKFEEFGWNSELDIFSDDRHSAMNKGRISVEAALEKLKELSDEETQFRINPYSPYLRDDVCCGNKVC